MNADSTLVRQGSFRQKAVAARLLNPSECFAPTSPEWEAFFDVTSYFINISAVDRLFRQSEAVFKTVVFKHRLFVCFIPVVMCITALFRRFVGVWNLRAK